MRRHRITCTTADGMHLAELRASYLGALTLAATWRQAGHSNVVIWQNI